MPSREEVFELDQLTKLLRIGRSRIRKYGEETKEGIPSEDAIERFGRNLEKYFHACRRVERANELLVKRELVCADPHKHLASIFVLSLTLEGFDLGRKYDNVWDWSNLWYQARVRHHWVWLLVTFAAGGVVMKFLDRFL